MVELASGDGAGHQAEELAEHGAGGAPHGVAHQLEEEDRPVLGPREASSVSSRKIAGSRQLGDAARAARPTPPPGLATVSGRPGSAATYGTMNEWLVTVARWSSSPISSTAAGSSAISSRALAQRGLPEVGVAVVLPAAGEAHLTRVGPHLPRTAGEHDVELAVVLVEGGQHGRRPVDPGQALSFRPLRGTGRVERSAHVRQGRAPLVGRQVGPRRGTTRPRR